MEWRPIDLDNLEEVIELSQRCHAVDGSLDFMFEPDEIKYRYLSDHLGSGITACTSAGQLVACASVSVHADPARQRAKESWHSLSSRDNSHT